MEPCLADRDGTVDWLRSQGFYAAKRDWSFGESVIVASGGRQLFHSPEEPVTISESGEPVVVYSHMLCIYPEAEHWAVVHLSGGPQPPKKHECVSLGAAALQAARLLAALAETDCGAA